MKKHFSTCAVSAAMIVCLSTCGLTRGQKATSEIEAAEETEVSTDVQNDDSVEWEEEEYGAV